jgi:hypothetical protein
MVFSSESETNPHMNIAVLMFLGSVESLRRCETRFCLSAKRTSPFKSAGASVQSTTGSRSVRISGGNAGYTMSPEVV